MLRWIGSSVQLTCAFAVLALGVLLGGCGTVTRDERLPLFLISPGSQLMLREPPPFVAGERLWFQNGTRVSTADLQRQKPYCTFTMPLRRDGAAANVPARFTVIRNVRRREWATLAVPVPQVGSQRTVPELFITRLFLSSEDSVDVYYLNC